MKRQFPCILKGSYAWLAFDKSNAITLDSDHGANKGNINFEDQAFKNITREYLSNTYGKVESKEHAEFIKLLAETNGVVVFKDGEIIKAKGINYFIVTNDGILYFWNDKSGIQYDRKQITIPMPPKEVESDLSKGGPTGPFQNVAPDSIETMTFDFRPQLLKPSAVNVINKTGLNLSFGINHTVNTLGEMTVDINVKDARVYEGDSFEEKIKEIAEAAGIADDLDLSKLEIEWTSWESDSDDWPKVGSEVTWGEREIIGTVKCIDNGWAWILCPDGKYTQQGVKYLKPPKTEDEKLRDEVKAVINKAMSHPLGFLSSADDELTDYMFNNFNITKKPQ